MPTIITIGSASARGFGFGTQTTSASAVTFLGLASSFTSGQGLTVDSSDNLYLSGTGPSNQWWVAKISPAGSVVWQQTCPTSNGGSGQGIALYGTTTAFSVGSSGSSSPTTPTILRLDPSTGSISSQTGISTPTSGNSFVEVQCYQSNGNFYVQGGFSEASTGNGCHLYKYNSSGSRLTSRYVGGVNSGLGLSLDPSENVFININSSTDNYQIKLASDIVTLVFSRNLAVGAFTAKASKQTASYVYMAGFDGFSSTTGCAVMKIDGSTGAPVWSRRLGAQSSSLFFSSIAVDSSENTYSIGVISGVVYIAKYDSSGNLVWQRSITAGTAVAGLCSISLTADQTKFYFSFVNASSLVFGKLPTDGSLTGSYTVGGQSVVYAVSSLTSTTTSITSTSSTNIFSNSTRAGASPSVSFSAASKSVSFLTV
jgi:hypothetical protein